MVRKVCGSIVLIVMPVLVFLLILRLVKEGAPADGEALLPEFSDIWSWLGTFPDFVSEIQSVVDVMQHGWNDVAMSFYAVHDWNSFWEAVGQFFIWFGNLFRILAVLFKIPFDVIGWILSAFSIF